MNPKMFVGIAVGIVVVIVGIVAFSGQSIINDTSSNKGILSSPQNPVLDIAPLDVELNELEVIEIDENFATISIKFKVSNPNQRSVILQFLKYQLFTNDIKIHGGQIGDRFEGFVEGSNFYTVLSQSHTVLADKITLKNTGNTPELWDALSAPPYTDKLRWQVTGDAFFNLSSMTAGGENSVTFDLVK